MKLFLAWSLMALPLMQTQTSVPDRSGLEIVEFSFKEQVIKEEIFAPGMVSNQPPVLNPDPNLMRVDRNESPLIARQREKERMAAMSSVGGVAHKNTPPRPLPINRNVYVFYAKMRNDNPRPITRFVWAYQPAQDFDDVDFLCNVKLQPGEIKEIKVISPIPRQRVVDAASSGTEPSAIKPALQHMIVNQIQFADETTWQRPNWNKTILVTRKGIKKLGKGKCMAL